MVGSSVKCKYCFHSGLEFSSQHLPLVIQKPLTHLQGLGVTLWPSLEAALVFTHPHRDTCSI